MFANSFQQITAERLTNELTKMYSQTFVGTSNTHNLSIWQSSYLPNGGFASSNRGDNSDTWEIYLNSSFSDTLTQEMWGSIIFHEMVHGFIDKNDLGFNQQSTLDVAHKEMLNNWILQIQSGLMEVYNLSATDALAISLEGFDDVLKVNQTFRADMNDWIQSKYGISAAAAVLAEKYYTGEKGTKCN